MNISKHTPGPWQFVTEERERKIIADGQEIMCDMHYYPWCPDNDADWRLIAAAPDLLTVLQELQESASYWSEYDVPLGIVDRINSAIAKATGEQV